MLAEYQDPPLFQGRSPSGGRESSRFTPNARIEHYSDFRSSGGMTAYPEVIPKKCGSVRMGDNPPGTPLVPL